MCLCVGCVMHQYVEAQDFLDRWYQQKTEVQLWKEVGHPPNYLCTQPSPSPERLCVSFVGCWLPAYGSGGALHQREPIPPRPPPQTPIHQVRGRGSSQAANQSTLSMHLRACLPACLPVCSHKCARFREKSERAAVNHVIQGSAADLVMTAMLRLRDHPALKQMGYTLIMQVHDEFLLEVGQR